MVELSEFFLLVGMVILVGFTGRLIRQRTSVPESLFLILFGLFLGPVTGLAPGDLLLQLVPIVSVAAMIAILVESGIEFDISRLGAYLGKATLFTLLIASFTTLLITVFLMFFFGWEPAYAALLGLISSGTTTITAMALLDGVNVSSKLRRMILLETIINDFTLIIGTFLIVEYIKVSAMSAEAAGKLIVTELSAGIMIGLGFGFLWRYILSDVNKDKGLNYASTIGLCFLMYYTASSLGGNPIIAIFTFALLMGNYHKIFSRLLPDENGGRDFEGVLRSIRAVHTDFSFFISSFFFVLLGVTFNMVLFEQVSPLMIGGILVLIVASRYLATLFSTRLDKVFSQYRSLISIMIPRGYVAAVLAFVPAQEGVDIPLFTDIIVVLLITTTLIAIVGTAIYARGKGRKV